MVHAIDENARSNSWTVNVIHARSRGAEQSTILGIPLAHGEPYYRAIDPPEELLYLVDQTGMPSRNEVAAP